MDRPTTRRGRHAANAGSVSVADLLARTTPAEMASVSAIQARAAAEASARAVEETMARTAVPAIAAPLPAGGEPPVSAVAEEPGTSRLARTIMVTVAAMLVCGVVTAIAVLTDERPQRLSPSAPSVVPAEITGATVVRPDLVNEQLAGGLLTVGRASPGSDLVGGLRPDDELGSPTAQLPSRQEDPAAPSEQVRRVVEEFYERAESSPARAFEMLAPQMQGDGLASFVAGWDNLLVEVQSPVVVGNGVARAVVVIAWPDATVLRTEQLLKVSEGAEPKIVRAQLLSAHRG